MGGWNHFYLYWVQIAVQTCWMQEKIAVSILVASRYESHNSLINLTYLLLTGLQMLILWRPTHKINIDQQLNRTINYRLMHWMWIAFDETVQRGIIMDLTSLHLCILHKWLARPNERFSISDREVVGRTAVTRESFGIVGGKKNAKLEQNDGRRWSVRRVQILWPQ